MTTLLIALLDSLMILSWLFAGSILAMIYVEVPFTIEQYKNWCLDFLNKNTSPYLPVAALVVYICVYLALYLRRKRTLSCSDIYIKGSGSQEIKISNRAVTEFIFKIIDNVDGIHTANVKVLSSYNRSRVYVKIRLSLFEGTSYPEINAELQDFIRVKLAEEMGIKTISSVDISLEKFVQKEEEDSYTDEGLLTE